MIRESLHQPRASASDPSARSRSRLVSENPTPAAHLGPAAELSHGVGDNRLIIGDNLSALDALEAEFAERVRCIYLDPPYNTGSTYTHYRDRVAHAAWLARMRERLVIMRRLLRPDGVLFISVDATEMAYLAVLLDELFGRDHACGPVIWEKKKKPSFLDANLGIVTEFILAYVKDRRHAPRFVAGVTTPGKMYPLNNAGNGRRVLHFPAGAVAFGCGDQVFEPQDMSAGRIVTVLLDRVEVRAGRNVTAFRLDGEWRYVQAKLDAVLAAGETVVIRRAPFRPNHVRAGGEPKTMKNLLTVAGGMSTYEDAAAESRALFGDAHAFSYPKPEQLIATLLGAVTEPGDWVLDAYGGSGTTGAVAHKMGRRWIIIEAGTQARTHIVPRLRRVIDGDDPGGMTAAAGWLGGGGFRAFHVTVAESSQGLG